MISPYRILQCIQKVSNKFPKFGKERGDSLFFLYSHLLAIWVDIYYIKVFQSRPLWNMLILFSSIAVSAHVQQLYFKTDLRRRWYNFSLVALLNWSIWNQFDCTITSVEMFFILYAPLLVPIRDLTFFGVQPCILYFLSVNMVKTDDVYITGLIYF